MWRPILLAGAFAAAGCSQQGPSWLDAPPSGEDLCRASAYQNLIGRPKSEIPPTPAGATWRTACTTCPITQDYMPSRLNFFFDEKNGFIAHVRCG